MKFLATLFYVLILASCHNNSANGAAETSAGSIPVARDSTNHDSVAIVLSKQILSALRNNDYETFSQFMHPLSGVRFSPYGYIDTISDIVLKKEELINHFRMEQQQTIKWGDYDGSGEPMLLTIDDYFNKFVYNVDFLHAPQTSLNKMIGSGNSLNNLAAIYTGCDFTEHYFPGFDEKYGGMDWCTLRLVFKMYNSRTYLAGIVHDQWTI